jgi:FixJ family two-component response regulator
MFQAHLSMLTPRQRQFFELVVRGKQNRQIAHQLASTERTIKAHRHEVMVKMGVESLAELVTAAERFGVMSAKLTEAMDMHSTSEVVRSIR